MREFFGDYYIHTDMPPKPPTLSVCMIVKNEEEKIARAIESFLPFADEIIVNDTGSTDKTIEILKKLQVDCQNQKRPNANGGEVIKIIQSEWIGDFSYSRNLSVEKATCSWILWMDADDVVPPPSQKDFLKWKKYPLNRIFQFRIIDTIENGRPEGRMFSQARMFPNRSDIRFSGKVHESFTPAALKADLEFTKTETVIWHTGYETPEIRKRKAIRNLEIQKNDPEQENSVTGLIELGDSYSMFGNSEKAIEYYRRATEFKGAYKEYIKTAMNKLGNALMSADDFASARDVFAECTRKFPQSEDAFFGVANAEYRLGNGTKTIEIFQKLYKMKPENSEGGSQHLYIRMMVLRNLTIFEAGKGNMKGALDYARFFAREYPANEEAQLLFEKLKEEVGK